MKILLLVLLIIQLLFDAFAIWYFLHYKKDTDDTFNVISDALIEDQKYIDASIERAKEYDAKAAENLRKIQTYEDTIRRHDIVLTQMNNGFDFQMQQGYM